MNNPLDELRNYVTTSPEMTYHKPYNTETVKIQFKTEIDKYEYGPNARRTVGEYTTDINANKQKIREIVEAHTELAIEAETETEFRISYSLVVL